MRGKCAVTLIGIAADSNADLGFVDFSSTTGLQLNGSAAQAGDRLRLTSAVADSRGSAWFGTKQRVGTWFETTLQFQITAPPAGGAAGFAFVIQNSGLTVLGESGGGLGYAGIPGTLAIEFDTWQNTGGDGINDPNDNHISIHTLGTTTNSASESASIGATMAIPNLSDGNVHTVRVRYSGGQLAVFVDNLNVPVLTVPVDLSVMLGLDDCRAWVGFTGGTGGVSEIHDILNWVFLEVPPTTINPANASAWSANAGWTDWRGNDCAGGASIGEYVCAGYIYSANVGWIHLGDGTPSNGVQYANTDSGDYGVNHDGTGKLRGLAWGASIRWLKFEETGAPKINPTDGKMSGHAWGANVGWINLGNGSFYVQTDTIQPGADTDGDGIADAYELTHAGNLTTMNVGTDTDGDGSAISTNIKPTQIRWMVMISCGSCSCPSMRTPPKRS